MRARQTGDPCTRRLARFSTCHGRLRARWPGGGGLEHSAQKACVLRLVGALNERVRSRASGWNRYDYKLPPPAVHASLLKEDGSSPPSGNFCRPYREASGRVASAQVAFPPQNAKICAHTGGVNYPFTRRECSVE
eukprot:306432-Chlamydomonas_euryale.AAC.1